MQLRHLRCRRARRVVPNSRLQAARPAKSTLALRFLTGRELDWLPEVMRVLHDL